MTTISALAAGLERQLNNTASFMAVSTRVLLRTGVSLREPKPAQNSDAGAVTKVRAALADMGYSF
ncbi:hypothetical protein AB0368_28055 [Actinoplanes sp. NPDC051475]|jgi:hypothetical protein|uniref:hypothetical protein n=1 Tax=Actinoplanes sp. NPDC051475 TaxID=3157225 RepID=UPI00344FCBC0